MVNEDKFALHEKNFAGVSVPMSCQVRSRAVIIGIWGGGFRRVSIETDSLLLTVAEASNFLSLHKGFCAILCADDTSGAAAVRDVDLLENVA